MSVFIDQAIIEVKAGKGGAGATSLRREKFVPRGGPDGGDGGHGGNICVKVDRNLRTLLEFKYKKIFHAQNGFPGSGSLCHGKDGKDLVIPVPPGTVVIDVDSEEVLADLIENGQKCIVASGGRGGKGNAHFASSTYQTPRFSQPGEPGQSRTLRLELKLLADVGLVGFPNAGKSTFIASISAAKPRIADYPFTTLIPNLGVVRRGPDRTFVVADIPGLIEGSHEGKGLGLQFLRHVERASVLLILVDVSPFADPDPLKAPIILLDELKHYRSDLASRISAIVATKIDLIESSDVLEQLKTITTSLDCHFYAISAATQKGVTELLNFLEAEVASVNSAEQSE